MITTFQRSFLRTAGSILPELSAYTVYATVVSVLYMELDLHFLPISPTPITILATAVTLLLTFRNNSAYDRWWEARKVWGGIVNQSRSFGAQVIALVGAAGTPPDVAGQVHLLHRDLIYRHLAYINAMRQQLRGEINTPELATWLPDGDRQQLALAVNRATQINRMQAQALREIREAGLLNDFTMVALQDALKAFFDLQGAAERIKNTPFPKVYDFTTRLVFWTFLLLLPLALLEPFGYKTIFFSWIVSFVFVEVIRIGIIMQDPFANGPNDVPMTAICRTIEIDLRQMLGESGLPAPLEAEDGVLM